MKIAETRLFKHMERAREKGNAEAHIDMDEWKEFIVALAAERREWKQALLDMAKAAVK